MNVSALPTRRADSAIIESWDPIRILGLQQQSMTDGADPLGIFLFGTSVAHRLECSFLLLSCAVTTGGVPSALTSTFLWKLKIA